MAEGSSQPLPVEEKIADCNIKDTIRRRTIKFSEIDDFIQKCEVYKYLDTQDTAVRDARMTPEERETLRRVRERINRQTVSRTPDTIGTYACRIDGAGTGHAGIVDVQSFETLFTCMPELGVMVQEAIADMERFHDYVHGNH